MWKSVAAELRRFWTLEPGRRFRTVHAWSRTQVTHPLLRQVLVWLGVLLVVFGITAGIIPGVPGIVLVLLGMALIATRSVQVARSLDWAEMRCRKFARNVQRRCRH